MTMAGRVNNRTQASHVQRRSRVMNNAKQSLKTLKSSAQQNNVCNAPQWQCYIEQSIGFVLPDEQLQWLMNAVEQTASTNGLSLEQLWLAVQTDRPLHQQLLDSVLIAESRFFRHLPSIQFVTKLATLALQKNKHKSVSSSSFGEDVSHKNVELPFRIWSVGCSSGQEVWSLAMSLAAQPLDNYTILGTDVSQKALAWARAGQYEPRQQHLIPQACQKFVHPVIINKTADYKSIHESLGVKERGRSSKDNNENVGYMTSLQRSAAAIDSNTKLAPWRVDSGLRQHVNFAWHNIFTQEMPTAQLQQVIICQNVLIYFRQFDQRDILKKLAAQCAIGGHIILAPGEGLCWKPANMRRISHPQVNVWQKISL